MKQRLIAVLPTLSAAAPASDFDDGLVARKLAEDVYTFVGRSEDFTMVNGGNIVNSGLIVAPEGVVVIDTGSSSRYGRQMPSAIAFVAAGKPVAFVINTHHHPDHFLGNQAFADAAVAALPETRQGIAADGNAFVENLFRLTADWTKGTEVGAPTLTLKAGAVEIAGRKLRLIKLDGYTESDLAVYDETSGVLFSGDLVFNGRAPTTPHADVATWLQSRMRELARDGLDMNEVQVRPLPPQFTNLPVANSEYCRSVGHLFPAAEQEALNNALLH